MRMLFTACPMYGHVNPVLPLALAADRAGHDVVVATGPDLVPHVARHGLAAWPVGPGYRQAGGGPDVDWLEYFAASAPARAADLMPRATRWRPDVVVTEETEMAGPVVAAATGARHVVHGIGIMPPPPIWEAYAAALRRLPESWSLPFGAEALRETAYLEICPPALRPVADRVWPRAMPLRPGHPEPGGGERLDRAMDSLPYADTVHLTLGTVFHGNREVLRTALRALRELPVNVVVAAGPNTEPSTFGPQPRHVLIESYVPHALLLPKCRLVVSQGGFGVVLAGLTHGAPQLVIPQGADQFRNAEAVLDAGAGLVLHPHQVTPAAVAQAAGRLLDGPSFAASARAVRAEIEAMPAPAAVLARLDR